MIEESLAIIASTEGEKMEIEK